MKKGDYITIVAIVFSAISIFFITSNKFIRDSGNKEMVITIDGDTYATEKIDDKLYREFKINSKYGKNIVVLDKGFVYMEESDCKDKICIKKGKISKTGDSIICLPNRLIVKIVSYDSTNELDSVVR